MQESEKVKSKQFKKKREKKNQKKSTRTNSFTRPRRPQKAYTNKTVWQPLRKHGHIYGTGPWREAPVPLFWIGPSPAASASSWALQTVVR